jgi:hypothetical protein
MLLLLLISGKPRAATVVSQTQGVLWRLNRDAFRTALQVGMQQQSFCSTVVQGGVATCVRLIWFNLSVAAEQK